VQAGLHIFRREQINPRTLIKKIQISLARSPKIPPRVLNLRYAGKKPSHYSLREITNPLVLCFLTLFPKRYQNTPGNKYSLKI
jgi:hypothetical protein